MNYQFAAKELILITDEVSCKIKTEEKKSAFFNFSKLLLEVIHRQVYLVLGESIIHMEHTGLLCTCITFGHWFYKNDNMFCINES